MAQERMHKWRVGLHNRKGTLSSKTEEVNVVLAERDHN